MFLKAMRAHLYFTTVAFGLSGMPISFLIDNWRSGDNGEKFLSLNNSWIIIVLIQE
jgi:hypothetical protein